MCNKKGFVFIETIVTIVVLAVSLLYVYSGFNNILIKEKTRVHYDDVAYIYRTYYVKNFFARYELNSVLKNLSANNPMIVIGCEYGGIFGDDATGKSICESLVNNLYITRISVALSDLSYVQECNFDESVISNQCAYLKNFSAEELAYLETIGELEEKNRYIMIVEYTEIEQIKVENSKTGETTDMLRDREVHNYAWVRI